MLFQEELIERNLKLLFQPPARQLRTSSLLPPQPHRAFARNRQLEARLGELT